MEIKFPFFNDVWRMHWLAQPFAVLCNLVMGLIALVCVILLYAIYVTVGIAVFALAIPVVVVSELWDWLSKI